MKIFRNLQNFATLQVVNFCNTANLVHHVFDPFDRFLYFFPELPSCNMGSSYIFVISLVLGNI